MKMFWPHGQWEVIQQARLSLCPLATWNSQSVKKYVNVNTHKCWFVYNCLPFDVTSTPAIFQRMIHKYYRVCAYIDNILVKNTTGCVHTSIIY